MAPAFVTPALPSTRTSFLGCSNLTVSSTHGHVTLHCARPRTSLRMIGDLPEGSENETSGTEEIIDVIQPSIIEPTKATAATTSNESMDNVDDVLKGLPSGITGGNPSSGEYTLENINDDDMADVKVLEQCKPPQFYVNAKAIAEVRSKFKIHETDSGSPEFQIATLTARIEYLTKHLKKNPKDHASTRGLLKMVATRTKLLKYLRRESQERFHKIIEGLNIRISQQLRQLGE